MQSTSSIQEPWNISPHFPGWKIHGNEEKKDSTINTKEIPWPPESIFEKIK